MTRAFSKKANRWTVVKVKEPKKYPHIPDLQAKIIDAVIADTGRMDRKYIMSDEDPRHIAPTIAPLAPIPTSELLEQHQSRFTAPSTSRSTNSD